MTTALIQNNIYQPVFLGPSEAEKPWGFVKNADSKILAQNPWVWTSEERVSASLTNFPPDSGAL